MTSIRVLIADDEPIARRGIRTLLASYGDVDVVGEARHGRETAQLLTKLRPDVLFLDVQMPELDGFQVLELVGASLETAIIFVTAFDTFAIKAFDADATDYLVKPINEARFRKAFNKVRDRLITQQAVRSLTQSLGGLASDEASTRNRSTARHARRILVSVGGKDVFLAPAEIDWIEAEDYYAAIYSGGRQYLLRESLSSLLERLNPQSFIRVHRTAIVNLANVKELRSDTDGKHTLLLRSGAELPLSRRRRAKVNEALRSFAGHSALK